MQSSTSAQQSSYVLIISHDQDDFNCLSSVLQHYFPHPSNQVPNNIMISNKYYKAQVELQSKFWKEVVGFQILGGQGNENNEKLQDDEEIRQQTVGKSKQNYDLMIMLVDQNQQSIINFQSLDLIIQKFNPQQFVLLINTSKPQLPWKHQETILSKCNNFIEIVKEDLSSVWKHKPQWARGALLMEEEDDNFQMGIFSIFDRMETTRWASLVDVNKSQQEGKVGKNNIRMQDLQTESKSQQKEDNKKQDNNQHNQKPTVEENQSTITTTTININTNTTETKPQQNQPHQESSDEQPDQNQLESQMIEFQKMMSQMMSFKLQSGSMKDDQRKTKAEQLFSKMFKGAIDG